MRISGDLRQRPLVCGAGNKRRLRSLSICCASRPLPCQVLSGWQPVSGACPVSGRKPSGLGSTVATRSWRAGSSGVPADGPWPNYFGFWGSTFPLLSLIGLLSPETGSVTEGGAQEPWLYGTLNLARASLGSLSCKRMACPTLGLVYSMICASPISKFL